MMYDATNFGFCQGIVKGAIFRPNDTVAKINVQIKSNRKNPNTKKYDFSMLNFTVYGETVKKVSELSDGDIVFLEYHLEERMQIDRKTGLAEFIDDFVIDEITVRGKASDGKLPYLNRGFLQGTFLGINEIPGSDGISMLDVLYIDPKTKRRRNHRFFVYGSYAERVARAFSKGKPVAAEYKLEKCKHVRRDGKTEYFTNCVIVELV